MQDKIRFDVLDEVLETKGTNKKIEIISNLIKESKESKEFIDIFYNDDIYNIAEISIDKVINTPMKLFIGNISFKEQIELMKNLTGNNKIDSLGDFFSKVPKKERVWYRKALLKNFPSLGKKSYNKCLKQCGFNTIEDFKLQLCKSVIIDTSGNVVDWNDLDTEKPNFVQKKLDGNRIYVVKTGNEINFISRNGIQFFSLGILKQELLKIFPLNDFIFDGEVVARNNDFNTLMTKMRKKQQMNSEDFIFGIFDVIKFDGIDFKNKPLKERYNWLLKNIKNSLNIEIVETNVVTTKLSILEMYNNIISKGGEGVVIKPENSLYEYGSRNNWWKLKPVYEGTFEVFDVMYGTGKNRGKISALWIKDKYSSIKCKVGSGFTEKDIDFCTNKGKGYLVGKFIDVFYNEIMDKGLRFPRLKSPNSNNESNLRIRFDKNEADDLIPLKTKFDEIKLKNNSREIKINDENVDENKW